MTKVYKYPDLSNEIEKDLAIILGKITHHIHPEIVKIITEENKKFKAIFSKICHGNSNVEAFFYPLSDCVFPGYRRPVNKEKQHRKIWKNHIYEPDGTILNDNTVPRHIWAYLTLGKGYTGGMWGESGLNKFELAHIFSHKQEGRQLESKAFELNIEQEPYALFTSASNVVLIPKGFAKPTDNMESIKMCFYKRHIDLYGNNLIGLSNFKESILPAWYDEINWLEPELPTDWEVKTKTLLKYRERHLVGKYSNT